MITVDGEAVNPGDDEGEEDEAFILKAMNQAVTRLYVQDDDEADEQAA